MVAYLAILCLNDFFPPQQLRLQKQMEKTKNVDNVCIYIEYTKGSTDKNWNTNKIHTHKRLKETLIYDCYTEGDWKPHAHRVLLHNYWGRLKTSCTSSIIAQPLRATKNLMVHCYDTSCLTTETNLEKKYSWPNQGSNATFIQRFDETIVPVKAEPLCSVPTDYEDTESHSKFPPATRQTKQQQQQQHKSLNLPHPPMQPCKVGANSTSPIKLGVKHSHLVKLQSQGSRAPVVSVSCEHSQGKLS